MAGSNGELARRVMQAWNERDIEVVRALARPDVEYVNPPEAVEPGTRSGIDAVVRVFEAQWEMLGPSSRVEIDELHDRGDEVIIEGRISRTMPGSDARIENRILGSMRFREGELVRFHALAGGSGFEAAREAAGLTDGSAS